MFSCQRERRGSDSGEDVVSFSNGYLLPFDDVVDAVDFMRVKHLEPEQSALIADGIDEGDGFHAVAAGGEADTEAFHLELQAENTVSMTPNTP